MNNIINASNTGKSTLKKGSIFTKKFLIPLALVLGFSSNIIAKNTKITNKNISDNLSTSLNVKDEQASNTNIYPMDEDDLNSIEKGDVAKTYLENNLFINGEPISNQKFNYEFENLGNDKYKISYDHEFEGIQNFADKTTKNIEMHISFTYKNNNIFVKFDNVSIGDNNIQDNGIFIIDNVVYDYDLSQNENKSIEINSKANIYKTQERIKNKIKKHILKLQTKIPNIDILENTQITELNNLLLGKEVHGDNDKYYREIYLSKDDKYRPISKIYFDKYGNLILDNNENNKELSILGNKIKFTLTKNENDNDLFLSFNGNDINTLAKKIKEHRETLINMIDKAKIGTNTDFTGFEKTDSKRIWNDEEVRLFNTQLISLDLTDDTYKFKRGKDENKFIYFGITHNNSGKDEVFLENSNNQKITEFYITTNSGYYKLELKNEAISMHKIKNEGENINDNLPEFIGDETIIAPLIDSKNHHYYDHTKTQLAYIYPDGNYISNINCKKDDKGKYKLDKNTTDVLLTDLYNFSGFSTTKTEIEKLQKKLNILNISILNSFNTILTAQTTISNIDGIKIRHTTGDVYYCDIKDNGGIITINNNMGFKIEKKQKLYDDALKSLEIIKNRLEIVDKLTNANINWVNGNQKEDFKKHIGGGWGIGTRFIYQDQILNFISEKSDELELNILRGEGESTIVKYDISSASLGGKITAKIKGKTTIIIDGIKYKLKIDDNLNIEIDPIEIK